MFVLGVLAGLFIAAVPRVLSIHKVFCDIDPKNTLAQSVSTLFEIAIVFLEQKIKKSVVYDRETKKHVVSFILGGKMYKLHVRQLLGPESRRVVDPFERGKLSLCT